MRLSDVLEIDIVSCWYDSLHKLRKERVKEWTEGENSYIDLISITCKRYKIG